MSTRLYPVDDKLAMRIDRVQKADRVGADRIVNEAERWGMRRPRAEQLVSDLLSRLPAAVSAAAAQTEAIPPELLDLIARRLDHLTHTAP